MTPAVLLVAALPLTDLPPDLKVAVEPLYTDICTELTLQVDPGLTRKQIDALLPAMRAEFEQFTRDAQACADDEGVTR
ncbi:MAG: hypothetical protein M0Z28_08275 [Rhodospirillales bacterium]|nr:hypothetical protein [Rhodospirillales bacterium]